MRAAPMALLAFMSIEPAAAADLCPFQLRDTGETVGMCGVAPGDANYANAMGLCHGILAGAFGC